MADETYRFCKIFLDAAEADAVVDLLTGLLDGPFPHRVLTLPDAVVEVLGNPDTGAADDFIGWPTLVEIEAADEAANASVVALTASIVTATWDAGIRSVAACDYEDELPWRGGLGRLEGPGQGDTAVNQPTAPQ